MYAMFVIYIPETCNITYLMVRVECAFIYFYFLQIVDLHISYIQFENSTLVKIHIPDNPFNVRHSLF